MLGFKDISSESCQVTMENISEFAAWVERDSSMVILYKEGPIPINFIGTPHDPLAEASWLNIPSSTLKKLHKDERSSFNRVGPSKKEPSLNSVLCVVLNKPTLLGKEIEPDDDIIILYQNMYKEKVANIEQKSKVMATRATRYYSLPYLETLLIAYNNNPKNKDIANNVFKKNGLISLFNDLINNVMPKCEPSDYVKSVSRALDSKLEAATQTLFKDDYTADEFEALFEMVLSLIENKVKLRRAITAVWTISVASGDMGVFCYVYGAFRDSFIESDFPHLNFELIRRFSTLLLEDKEIHYIDENLPTTVAEPSQSTPTTEVNNYVNSLATELSSNGPALEKLSTLCSSLESDEGLKVKRNGVELLKNEIKEYTYSITQSAESIFDEKFDLLVQFKIASDDLIDQLKLIERDENVFYQKVFKELMRVSSTLKDCNEQITAIKKTNITLEARIAKIHTQAAQFSKDVLGNVDNIVKMKASLDSAQDEKQQLLGNAGLKATLKQATASLEGPKNAITECSQFKLISSDEITQKESEIEWLNSELITANEEKSNVTTELAQSKQKLAALNAQLQATQSSAVVGYEKPDLSTEIMALLEGKGGITDMFNLVQKLWPDNIVMSERAIKSMSNIKHFKNFSGLFNKLNTLVSDTFIETYTNKGSIGAFNFLSKNELSFQESHIVKCRNTRSIKFKDYGNVDCKAHLKIGVDNSEQHMLRVYFAIINKKIYVGDVCRHLPTSQD